MQALPAEGVDRFEAWLRSRWADRSWYVRRGSLACSFGLLGLRWCEVASVRPGDLLMEAESLFVRTGKRGRPRTIEAPRGLLEAAAELRRAIGGGDDRVFTTRRGRGMVYEDVRRFVRSATTHVFGRPFSFHCLRHTAAVRVYQRTGDVLAVQRYLGHKSLMWTNAYLQSLMVVELGGPVAFAGGGKAIRPRIYDPDGLGSIERVRPAASRGKSGAAGDEAAFDRDVAAEEAKRPQGRRHDCKESLMPIKWGKGDDVRAATCTRCGRVWVWSKGESFERAKVAKENRAVRMRSAAEVQAQIKEEEEKRRTCEHANLVDRREGDGRVSVWCTDCGRFYGFRGSERKGGGDSGVEGGDREGNQDPDQGTLF